MGEVYPESWVKKIEEGLASNPTTPPPQEEGQESQEHHPPPPPPLPPLQVVNKSIKPEGETGKSLNELRRLEEKIQRLQRVIQFIVSCTRFDIQLLRNQGFDISELDLPPRVSESSSPSESVSPEKKSGRKKKSTILPPNAGWEAQVSKVKENQPESPPPPIFPLLNPKPEPLDGEDGYMSNEDCELYGMNSNTSYGDSLLPAAPDSSSSHLSNRPPRLIGHILGPIYSCSHCPETFEEVEKFDKHNLEIHGVRKRKIYTCEYCGKVDRWKGKHFNHVRTHTGEKPFNCTICGHCAKTSQYLKEHLKIHSDEKPFPCDQCEQRFRRRPEVKMHKKKAHNINNDLVRTCPICKAEFKDNGKLQRHIQDIHENKRTVKCHLCGQPFKRKEHLEKHLERHNNPKRRKRGPQKPNPRNKPPKKEGDPESQSGSEADKQSLMNEGGVPAPSAICETVLGEQLQPSSRSNIKSRKKSARVNASSGGIDTRGSSLLLLPPPPALHRIEIKEDRSSGSEESESEDYEEGDPAPFVMCETVLEEPSSHSNSEMSAPTGPESRLSFLSLGLNVKK